MHKQKKFPGFVVPGTFLVVYKKHYLNQVSDSSFLLSRITHSTRVRRKDVSWLFYCPAQKNAALILL